jgi:pantoate--beta-alanine ligase
MRVVHTVTELQEQLELARITNKIVFVPTMGALHEGHLELVTRAFEEPESFVVMSIFVNPTQFGKGEDFDRYPRTLDEDIQKLEALAKSPDVLFVPDVLEVYGEGEPEVSTPRAGAVGVVFEGASRPGHFDGMLHIVAWFFRTIKPEIAVFGAKDAQQVYLIRRMVHREFKDNIEILEVDTVREADGLAKSSRNRFLSAEGRAFAPFIFLTLNGVETAIAGGMPPSLALAQARKAFEAQPLAKLDYLALVDKSTFQPIADDFSGLAQLLVAVVVEGVRLIDNITFSIQEPA